MQKNPAKCRKTAKKPRKSAKQGQKKKLSRLFPYWPILSQYADFERNKVRKKN